MRLELSKLSKNTRLASLWITLVILGSLFANVTLFVLERQEVIERKFAGNPKQAAWVHEMMTAARRYLGHER